mgnify:CR=1 FL=1
MLSPFNKIIPITVYSLTNEIWQILNLTNQTRLVASWNNDSSFFQFKNSARYFFCFSLFLGPKMRHTSMSSMLGARATGACTANIFFAKILFPMTLTQNNACKETYLLHGCLGFLHKKAHYSALCCASHGCLGFCKSPLCKHVLGPRP